MGPGAWCILLLLGLFGVTSVRNETSTANCWVKGKEVSLSPLQCPAVFDGANAKFCCRICFGANCCLPRKPRVNQSKCPRETRLPRAVMDRATTTPAAQTMAIPEKPKDMGYLALGFVLLVVLLSLAAFKRWCQPSKGCLKFFTDNDEESDVGREETNTDWIRTARNLQAFQDVLSDLPNSMYPPTPPAYNAPVDDPPPYSQEDPLGSHSPPLSTPPSYRRRPVVAFLRSGSQSQDDQVVILPRPAGRPRGAARGGATEVAARGHAPEGAVSEDAPEEANLPEAAASGSAPEPPEPPVGQ